MVKVSVCIGSACRRRGANDVIACFEKLVEELSLQDKVEIAPSFCTLKCNSTNVVVRVNDEKYGILLEEAKEFFEKNVLPLVK
jgi:NADH:ubiquinone oxidoreductase subunit E